MPSLEVVCNPVSIHVSAPLEYSEDCDTVIYGDETHISPVVPLIFLPCCTSSAPGTDTGRRAGVELVK